MQGVADDAGGEGDGGAAAGDVAGHDQEQAAAFLEGGVGPADGGAVLEAAAAGAADLVGDVVPDEGAAAAATITRPRWGVPSDAANTPAVITAVSLGTTGKNASITAMASRAA